MGKGRGKGLGRGGDDEEDLKICCGIFIFLILLTGVILLSVSFGTVTPLQAGIRYNNNQKNINENEIFYNGRYFVGLGLSFIKFPLTWRVTDMTKTFGNPVRAWSKEGQLVQCDLSFYWELEKDKIIDFYHRYGSTRSQYKAIFERIAIRTVKRVTVEYEATEFFTKREEIGRRMQEELRARFAEEHVNIPLFALRSIDLPDVFEAKIVEKVVTAQQVKTEVHIKNTNVALADIDVTLGAAEADIVLLLAEAEADAIVKVEQAKSEGYAAIREIETELYRDLGETLGFDAQQLVQYRFAQLARSLEDSMDELGRTLDILVGFDSPTIVT